MITRGFVGRRPRVEIRDRLPPGQSETLDFPVLSIGPSPLINMDEWKLSIKKEGALLAALSWRDFVDLEKAEWSGDIHCVTRWSKFDTRWRGVTIDVVLKAVGIKCPPAFLTAISLDCYSTNLRTFDLLEGKALIATHFEDRPLDRHHGGPARLLVPQFYFWKSAKWLCELDLSDTEIPGFWETRGYHLHGDPWREQRFEGE